MLLSPQMASIPLKQVSCRPDETVRVCFFLPTDQCSRRELNAELLVLWLTLQNTACHFCDHAARRPGRQAVALMVGCGKVTCRKVFCSRPACMRKLPEEAKVSCLEDFASWKRSVLAGRVQFVCSHCIDESACPGPQCRKRWEKKQRHKKTDKKRKKSSEDKTNSPSRKSRGFSKSQISQSSPKRARTQQRINKPNILPKASLLSNISHLLDVSSATATAIAAGRASSPLSGLSIPFTSYSLPVGHSSSLLRMSTSSPPNLTLSKSHQSVSYPMNVTALQGTAAALGTGFTLLPPVPAGLPPSALQFTEWSLPNGMTPLNFGALPQGISPPSQPLSESVNHTKVKLKINERKEKTKKTSLSNSPTNPKNPSDVVNHDNGDDDDGDDDDGDGDGGADSEGGEQEDTTENGVLPVELRRARHFDILPSQNETCQTIQINCFNCRTLNTFNVPQTSKISNCSLQCGNCRKIV